MGVQSTWAFVLPPHETNHREDARSTTTWTQSQGGPYVENEDNSIADTLFRSETWNHSNATKLSPFPYWSRIATWSLKSIYIYKCKHDQKHGNYINLTWCCYLQHALIHLPHQKQNLNLFLFLLREVIQLVHSYNEGVSLHNQCQEKTGWMYPTPPNSMLPAFSLDTNDLPWQLWSNDGDESILDHHIPWQLRWGHFLHCAYLEST